MEQHPTSPRPGGVYRRIPLKPHQLTEAITPTRDVFVLAHLGLPSIDAADWTLAVDGLVHRPRLFTLGELRRLPKREVQSFHECAGNPLTPHVAVRRVANVVWGGIGLETLLDEVGVDGQAQYVWSYGADRGVFEGTRCEFYLKDLPLQRGAGGDVLVAYELNGEPLSLEHGCPLRLFVPGWYGTNSVKWLCHLTLADRRADGLFTTTFYNEPDGPAAGDAPPRTRPVWEVAPESVIVSPAPNQCLPLGRPIEIWGRAWAPSGIRAVEISVDGGQTWQTATVEAREQWSWQRFSASWRPSEAGAVTLACRAHDCSGATQPPAGARNAIHTVTVAVAP